MKTLIARLFLSATLLLGAAAVVRAADDLAAIKSRMTERVSKIDTLKTAGALGEDNAGLLEVRDPKSADAAKVADDENKDRTAVYAALAKQASSTPDVVAKARAKKIAADAAAGVWIQDDKGAWAKKK